MAEHFSIRRFTMYYATTCPSPVGRLTLACDGENLVGLWMEGQKYFGGTIGKTMIFKEDLPVFEAAKGWLNRYFAGEEARHCRAAAAAYWRSIPARRMEPPMRNSLWRGCHLWRSFPKAGGPSGKNHHVQSGGGGRGGPQSDFHHHPLPPGCGGRRQLNGLRRRH